MGMTIAAARDQNFEIGGWNFIHLQPYKIKRIS